MNIVLRGKGLGGEAEEVLEFICCCCCATAVDGPKKLLNGIVIIIATANTMAVASNRFLIGMTGDYSSNLFLCMKIYGFFKITAADPTGTAGIQIEHGELIKITVVIIHIYTNGSLYIKDIFNCFLCNAPEYSLSDVQIHANRILVFKVHFGV